MQSKIDAQKKYCKINGLPNFAGSGKCFSCGKNVFDKLSIEESSNKLITACPYCNRSFCD